MMKPTTHGITSFHEGHAGRNLPVKAPAGLSPVARRSATYAPELYPTPGSRINGNGSRLVLNLISCPENTGRPCMFTLSAFADEIGPDPKEQIAVLKSCGVRHIEFRSVHKT